MDSSFVLVAQKQKHFLLVCHAYVEVQEREHRVGREGTEMIENDQITHTHTHPHERAMESRAEMYG